MILVAGVAMVDSQRSGQPVAFDPQGPAMSTEALSDPAMLTDIATAAGPSRDRLLGAASDDAPAVHLPPALTLFRPDGAPYPMGYIAR
ncbi:MAG: hypothetical protein QNJ84_14570 [Alphaproteobacteria bacterium]|nr:hypothetical protein [Alphaproteobacteria bacterium]